MSCLPSLFQKCNKNDNRSDRVVRTSYRPQKWDFARNETGGPFGESSFSPKITQRRTTSHNSENGRFCYRTMCPPSASFGYISTKNQATKPALEPNWASGPYAKCCHALLPISPVQHSTGLPSTHLCFFLYYAIIITEVDDDGMEILLHNNPDTGHWCRQSRRGIGGVGRHSGREEWLQSDHLSWQKNHGEFGGDTTIINCTVVIAGIFFYFLLLQIIIYSNIFERPHIDKNDNTQHMLKKWKATTSHNFNSLSEQPLSSHIVIKHEHPSWISCHSHQDNLWC